MRIDIFLSQKYGTRSRAADAVKNGEVLYDGKTVKPSFNIEDEKLLTFAEKKESYVSNGGYKLSKALNDFNIDVRGKVFIDVGASTGGFTDCLIKNGAKKVYAVDVGTAQLDESLKNRTDIVSMEKTNAKSLSRELFKEPLEGATVDISFISIKHILPVLRDITEPGSDIIALIKPQFECGRGALNKNGIVTDKKIRHAALKDIMSFCVSQNMSVVNATYAPIKKDKNTEYLFRIKNGGFSVLNTDILDNLP